MPIDLKYANEFSDELRNASTPGNASFEERRSSFFPLAPHDRTIRCEQPFAPLASTT